MCQDVLIPNNTRKPFNDLRVRRAPSRTPSTAPSSSIASISTRARPVRSPILSWAYTPETRQCRDDVAAQRLLDEAGFKAGRDGERFAITFTHAANQQRLAQALRQQLGEVGITLNLQTLDFNAAVEQVFVKKTFDLGVRLVLQRC